MLFLLIFILLSLLLSCSRESPEFVLEPQTSLDKKEYQGGLFQVWVNLKDPVENVNSINWSTTGNEAYRNQGLNSNGSIIADTAYIYWDEPPPFKLDSTDISTVVDSSVARWKIDTLYIDTIFAIVDGIKSQPLVISIKNILPKIKSISVGGLEQPGDSTLTIAANPGATITIEMRFENPFNNSHKPKVEGMDALGGTLISKEQSDSLWLWEWTAPNKALEDSSFFLRIKDSNGFGERLYKVNLVVYNDYGSVWVASKDEVVKYSPSGALVVRIRDKFERISDIAVNSETKELFVIDERQNIFAAYDCNGKNIFTISNQLNNPTSLAVSIKSDYVWVADAERLRAFKGQTVDLEYDLPGHRRIEGLSASQFQKFLWFTVPDNDTVGYIQYSPENNVLEYKINDKPGKWNRPSMVSVDPENNDLAWIADSTRILAIDTAGNERSVITGFGPTISVSASRGSVWASDIDKGKVYRFKGLANKTVIDGMTVDGFSKPTFVSAYIFDGSAWVMDEGAGKAIRIDSLGNIIATGIGLIPSIGKTVQKVE